MFSDSLLHPSVLSVNWCFGSRPYSDSLFCAGQGRDGGVELYTFTAVYQSVCCLPFHHVKLD